MPRVRIIFSNALWALLGLQRTLPGRGRGGRIFFLGVLGCDVRVGDRVCGGVVVGCGLFVLVPSRLGDAAFAMCAMPAPYRPSW